MINYKEVASDGEQWEQFAQEFLNALGLLTESPPDRGADGGKDLIMIEKSGGILHSLPFRWLVSCKHLAHSGASVSEVSHERNILERVKAFRADGFLGFYSTIPSAGLNTRLRQLVDSRDLRAYKILDQGLIESELLAFGRSWLIRRYFPDSYKTVRPLHPLIDRYVPIECDECGKDLLEALYTDNSKSLIAEVRRRALDSPRFTVLAVYCACKGDCDRALERKMYGIHGEGARWVDLSDVAMPNQYLRWVMGMINQLRRGDTFSDEAFDRQKELIIAVGQKVLREVTADEHQRLRKLIEFLG